MQGTSNSSDPHSGLQWRVLHQLIRFPYWIVLRIGLFTFARDHSYMVAPGERMITMDVERDRDGGFWVVSDRAVYIEPKDSTDSRRLGRNKTTRIAYEDIEDVSEFNHGHSRTRTLLVGDTLGGTREISGVFTNRRWLRMTHVIREQVATRRRRQ